MSTIDPLLLNMTDEVSQLKLQLAELTKNMGENNNAFFLVTMALIIFCEFFKGLNGIVVI